MTDETKKLIETLREYAEWAEANEWEVPITLSDSLYAAANTIEQLSKMLETEIKLNSRFMVEFAKAGKTEKKTRKR